MYEKAIETSKTMLETIPTGTVLLSKKSKAENDLCLKLLNSTDKGLHMEMGTDKGRDREQLGRRLVTQHQVPSQLTLLWLIQVEIHRAHILHSIARGRHDNGRVHRAPIDHVRLHVHHDVDRDHHHDEYADRIMDNSSSVTSLFFVSISYAYRDFFDI